MKIVNPVRRRRPVFQSIETLERRQLLSASLISQIASQTLAQGQTSSAINLATYFHDPTVTGTAVVIQTPLGNIPMVLTDSATPQTVANFTQYITSGEYTNTIIHRSVPGFVIQGGGYTTSGSHITTTGTIPGEHNQSNTTGTIAMALSSGPDSGTCEWFINLADNPILDGTADGGPFTVFGSVVYNGMNVVNSIAALPIVNDSTQSGAWNTVPVRNGTNGATVTTEPASNLITIVPEILPGGLTYSAQSSNASVVTASVDASGNLTLTSAGGGGSSNITITATDMGGGIATSTFAVNVAGVPVVSVANATIAANPSAQAVFPVTLSAVSNSAVTLNYTLSGGTAPTTDYSATGSSLTIPAGSTTANIPVNILADTSGTTETFNLVLSNLSSGTNFFGGGASLTAIGTILPAGTTSSATVTTLTAAQSAVAEGSTDTFVATVATVVAGGSPTGTVQFSVGGVSLGTAALVNGSATLTNILSTPGNETIIASYSGNGAFDASTSNPLTVNVGTLTPTVSKSTLAPSVIAGNPLHATVLVVAGNSSGSIEKGPSKFNLFASTDGLIDDSSVLITSVNRPLNLKPGKSVSVPIQLHSLPANLSAGTYTLMTQTIDPAGNISNAASGPALAVVAPVITLTTVISRLPIPAAMVAGATSRVSAVIRITNSGNIASVGSTTIAFIASADGTAASGTPFATLTRRLSIPVGRTVSVTVPLGKYPSVADGNYFLLAQVTDPKAQVTSTQFGSTVNIAAAKLDLSNAIVSVPTSARTGRTAAVTLSITNNGNINATGKLQVLFSASTSAGGSNPVQLATLTARINLPPGKTTPLHFHVPLASGTPTGQIYLVAVLDPTDLFNDVNLTNNTAVSSTFITIT